MAVARTHLRSRGAARPSPEFAPPLAVAIAVLLTALALAATLSYAADVGANAIVVALTGIAAIAAGGFLPTLVVRALHRGLARREATEAAVAPPPPRDEPPPLQRR